MYLILNKSMQGFFWAYAIADIESYSQLKIVSFFPIHKKKFPIESYKIEKKNNKNL